MGLVALQIILVFVWVFIVAIDQFDFLESLYQLSFPVLSSVRSWAISHRSDRWRYLPADDHR